MLLIGRTPAAQPVVIGKDACYQVRELKSTLDELKPNNCRELVNDARALHVELITGFKLGFVSLEDRAAGESLFTDILIKALQIWDRNDASDEELRFDLALALSGLGDGLRETGDLAGSGRVLAESEALLNSLPRTRSAELNSAHILVADNNMRLGKLYVAEDRLEDACVLLNRAADVLSNVPEGHVQKLAAMDHLETSRDALRLCEKQS